MIGCPVGDIWPVMAKPNDRYQASSPLLVQSIAVTGEAVRLQSNWNAKFVGDLEQVKHDARADALAAQVWLHLQKVERNYIFLEGHYEQRIRSYSHPQQPKREADRLFERSRSVMRHVSDPWKGQNA